MTLIDADALTAEIKSMSVTISGEDVFPQTAKASVVDHIRFQPTIDAVPVVHGQWDILVEPNIFDTCGTHAKYAICTNCGFGWSDIYAVKNYFKCCPHCGAIMDEARPNG